MEFLNNLLSRALQFVGVALINVLVRNGSKLRGTCSAVILTEQIEKNDASAET
jgi:hypothetical protein